MDERAEAMGDQGVRRADDAAAGGAAESAVPVESRQPAAARDADVEEAAAEELAVSAVPLASSPERTISDEAKQAAAAESGGSVGALQSQDAGTAPEPSPVRSPEAAPRYRLDRKHPLAIRWMHWINFPVLFTMIWSGLLIYWNDSIPLKGYAHQVYRVGIGNFTLFRFFPEWFYTAIHAQYNVTKGLGYHFFFMWIFAVNGVVYVLFLLISKEWKFMVPERRSFADAIQVTLVDLHLRKGLPDQTKYNGAQRIAYTSVIVMGAGALVTGLAIYKPTQTHWLTTLLGGYEMARWLHFLLTLGFCGFFVVHVVQVALAGWNNFRSMVSGYEIKRAEEPWLEAERRTF